MKRVRVSTTLAVCLLSVVATQAADITIVTPSTDFESQEGDFGSRDAIAPFRSQALHLADQFSDLPAGVTQLVGTSVRLHAGEMAPVVATWEHLKLTLGTTRRTSLSSNFAANYDSDPVVVYDGPIVINLGISDDGPNPFFDFPMAPFDYDPRTDGNLIVDFSSTSGNDMTYQLDAANTSSTTFLSSSDPSSLTGQTFTAVLIRDFTFVPEPASLTLLSFASVGLLSLRSR